MSSAEDSATLDTRVRAIVYDGFLSEGAALEQAEIAERLSLPKAGIAAAFERLAAAHLLVLQPESRELLMANPFSAVPTGFRVRCGERAWWANCVWDGLGVLAMTGLDGVLATSCPDCGEALTLGVSAGRLLSGEGLIHFAVPAAHWWEDIVYT